MFGMLADAGYASVEVGGNYHGNSASEFKALADQFGLGVAGSHVPGGHNAWRNNIEQVLDEAETLGIKYAGVAIPAGDVPRTVDGFRRFNLTPVGKREIDFAKIFSALKNVKHHQYLVEEDDAPNSERNPAGESNTSWFSRKHLAKLDIEHRGRGHGKGKGRRRPR